VGLIRFRRHLAKGGYQRLILLLSVRDPAPPRRDKLAGAMNFDELLKSYKGPRKPSPALPPPPPEAPPAPEPEGLFWRITKPLIVLIDVVAPFYLAACCITWNDIREQAASPWPRRIDYLVFCFFSVYGMCRAVYPRWRHRLRYLAGSASVTLAVFLIYMCMTISPPGLLIRLSAAFDDSPGEIQQFVVLDAYSRSRGSRTGSSTKQSGYFSIAREGKRDESWEVWLGIIDNPHYGGREPAHVKLKFHKSRFGFDWIDRNEPQAVYELQQFFPKVDLETTVVVLVRPPPCYDEGLDSELQQLVNQEHASFFMGFQGSAELSCNDDRSFSEVGFKFFLHFAESFINDEVLPFPRGTAFIRCPGGGSRVVALRMDEVKSAISSCNLGLDKARSKSR
jgi:hypothetical protein